MKEEWRSVAGYEGVYSVSDQGRVRRDKGGQGAVCGRVLTNKAMNTGYLAVTLVSNGVQKTRTVHSLIAEAFIGQRNDLTVNHKDGNKLNNAVDNLEYITRSANSIHAYAIGLYHRPTVCRNGHLYDNQNTRITSEGRNCRECRKASLRRYRQKSKTA